LKFADPLTIDLAGYDGIVVSPGVPLNTHPIAARAKAAGVPVIGDIELFALARPSLPPHKVVGITGTNGKSTTTALIHHILTTAGVPTTMGGNIGLPILGQEPLPEGGVYVLELSSFQIDLTHSLDCDVAVLTNITTDHLDRYDGFEGYVASKQRLFEMQSAEHCAVTTDDPESNKLWERLLRSSDRKSLWAVSTSPEGLGVAVFQGEASIFFEDFASQSDWPTLQGPHNAQNAACAIAACHTLGLSNAAIAEGLRTYPGLPHRMERIAEIDGVLYVNDSKATNATSTAPALGAYPKIHWIVGGRRKTDDLDACAPFYGHVVAAYAIGEATDLYTHILREAGIAVLPSETLAIAVKQAAAAARPGETVLLSPACASYDQFSDYEARGDAFRGLVMTLSTQTSTRPGRMA
jgi:UDP-N-acetylmuramoylalanine--D-glutamate ligase